VTTQAELDEKYPPKPVQITEEQWFTWLEILPPEHWTHTAGFESFNLMEHAYGPPYSEEVVALICVWDRRRHQLWQYYGPAYSTHEQRVARIEAARLEPK
jgi:hypothetical protein